MRSNKKQIGPDQIENSSFNKRVLGSSSLSRNRQTLCEMIKSN